MAFVGHVLHMSQLLNEHLVLPPPLLLLRHALVLVLVVVVVVLVKIRLLLLVVLLLTMLVLLIILMGVYVVVQCRNVHRWWTIGSKTRVHAGTPRLLVPLQDHAIGTRCPWQRRSLDAYAPFCRSPRCCSGRDPSGDDGPSCHMETRGAFHMACW